MSKRDITILVFLVALASGYVGHRVGASSADTRVEVVERACEEETTLAVERVEARNAACAESSRRAELALGMLPEREDGPAPSAEVLPDAGIIEHTARPEVTDPQTRATATALIDQALARRTISSSDRAAFTALMPRLSQADQELLVERVMTAMQTGQLTIVEEP